jgi:heme exporter protein B
MRMTKWKFIDLLRYDLLTPFRHAFSWLTPLLFFLMIVCLFPLAIGQDSALMTLLAPGMIWIAALLSTLLSIGSLFKNDADEGFLDIILLNQHSLMWFVFSRMLSFWILNCLPLILLIPLLSVMFNLSWQQEEILLVTLLLGTPVLCLLGAIGAALITGLRGSGFLLPILIVPLYIPVLVFGAGTVMTTSSNTIASFAMMGAILIISLTVAPFLIAAALRIGVQH